MLLPWIQSRQSRPVGVIITLIYHRGDLDSIKVLVENGVNCSIGDYDLRTVLILSFSFNFLDKLSATA